MRSFFKSLGIILIGAGLGLVIPSPWSTIQMTGAIIFLLGLTMALEAVGE